MEKILHFLHIGKTGGTAIKQAFVDHEEIIPFKVILHPHEIKLYDLIPGNPIFFFLRDPVTRFCSGFSSRQRKGQPKYYVEWSKAEKIAFENFESPEDLALSLSDPERSNMAVWAMHKIMHLKDPYWDWFVNEDYLMSRKEDIAFIGFQESLEEDFELLKQKFSLPGEVSLPTDIVLSHKNPRGSNYQLSKEAEANIKKWFKEDYRLIDLCKKLRKKM